MGELDLLLFRGMEEGEKPRGHKSKRVSKRFGSDSQILALGSVEPALHLGTTVELILVATVWEMQPRGMYFGRTDSATCLP